MEKVIEKEAMEEAKEKEAVEVQVEAQGGIEVEVPEEEGVEAEVPGDTGVEVEVQEEEEVEVEVPGDIEVGPEVLDGIGETGAEVQRRNQGTDMEALRGRKAIIEIDMRIAIGVEVGDHPTVPGQTGSRERLMPRMMKYRKLGDQEILKTGKLPR